MKNYLLLLFGIALLSVGCYKDTDDTPPSEVIIEISDVFVNTSISGSVVDINGDLVSEYNLIVNDQANIISSDYFYLQLEDLKKKGQTIHVIKDDKQIGIRTQLLVENDINHMEIQQHDQYSQKTISNNNKQLNINNALAVDFSSTKWTGGYNDDIIIDYIDIPSSNSLTPVGYSSQLDLFAIDSKGGFYLSAKTVGNDPVIAQEDNPILITLSDLDENVNSLFVFDKVNEIWNFVTDISSGDEVAILGEGYYTFANYAPGVFVEGIVTKEEKPVAYQPMEWDLSSLSNRIYATEKGRWIALLPELESVKMNLLNPCDESLQTETLNVDVEDLAGQNLVIDDSDNYQLLDVTILDCNGDIVSAPSLNVINGESEINYVFSEEYPDRWIAVCDEFALAAVSESSDGGGAGPALDWSTDIEGGFDVITNCNEFEEGYSFIKIRDDEKIYKAFDIVVDGDVTILKSQDGEVKFIFKGTEKGMYNVDEVNVLINDIEFGQKGYYIKCENSSVGCGINDFNVTHYESNETGMLRVTFSGVLWMQTLTPTVAGNFDVEGVIVIKL